MRRLHGVWARVRGVVAPSWWHGRRVRAEREVERIFALSPALLAVSGFDAYLRRCNAAFAVLGRGPRRDREPAHRGGAGRAAARGHAGRVRGGVRRRVLRSGRLARMEGYEDAPGVIAVLTAHLPLSTWRPREAP